MTLKLPENCVCAFSSGASHRMCSLFFYNSSVYPSPFHSPVSIPCHILCVLVSVAIASFVELFIIIHDRHNIFVPEINYFLQLKKS